MSKGKKEVPSCLQTVHVEGRGKNSDFMTGIFHLKDERISSLSYVTQFRNEGSGTSYIFGNPYDFQIFDHSADQYAYYMCVDLPDNKKI